MSSTELAKLKKALADLDARFTSMQASIECVEKRMDDTCDLLDKKYAALVESMKSVSGVQSHAILHQIRSEMRIEFQKMQRDLRDVTGLRY